MKTGPVFTNRPPISEITPTMIKIPKIQTARKVCFAQKKVVDGQLGSLFRRFNSALFHLLEEKSGTKAKNTTMAKTLPARPSRLEFRLDLLNLLLGRLFHKLD